MILSEDKVLSYKLIKSKHKDQNYLDWIDRQKSLIARSPSDSSSITHHHYLCSGGKFGNDYLSLPFTWYQHTQQFHSGTPEDEVFDIHGIEPVREIIEHLSRYLNEVLNYNIKIVEYSEWQIERLIKIIEKIKST